MVNDNGQERIRVYCIRRVLCVYFVISVTRIFAP